MRAPRKTSLLAILAATACDTPPETAALPPPPVVERVVAVYSEFSEPASAIAHLPALAAAEVHVTRAVTPADFRTPALRDLILATRASGLAFRAWLVLPEAQGYWPNEKNLEAFGAAVDDLLAWIAEAQLPVDAITFDLEPDWDYTHRFIALAGAADDPDRIPKMLALVRAEHNPEAFLRNRDALGAIIGRVHAAGLKAHCVTYPMVVDDLADGDTDIQDGLNIPVSGLPWDEVSFMVYRSGLALYTTEPLTPWVVHAYARDARLHFGDAAGIDLGVIGDDPLSGAPGYRTPDALEADVAAIRAAGVSRVHLYSLELAASRPDFEAWLDALSVAAGAPPAEDGAGEELRGLFSLLDQVLATE